MAAGQRDIPVLLQPGNGATVRAPGEFLYLKFADREIQAIVTGRDGTQSRVKMVTGDFTAPGGGIDEVELINPDTTTPCAVVITVGDGEFDRKIIQGEVTITPGIRGADGQFVDDTRSTVRLRVALGNLTQRDYTAGDVMDSADVSGLDGAVLASALNDGRLLLSDDDGHNWSVWSDFPNGAPEPIVTDLGDGRGEQIGPEFWAPAGISTAFGGRIAFQIYDAATLKHRRDVTTEAVWGGTSGNPRVRALVSLPGDRIAVAHADNDGGVTSILSQDGALLKTLPAYGRSLIVRDGVLHVIGDIMRASSWQLFDATTLAPLDDSHAKVPTDNNFRSSIVVAPGDTLIAPKNYSYLLERFALTDIHISASGSVTSCAGGGFLKSSPIDTQAEIYTQRLDDGRVLMSGEILRAALEIYTGRYMPANYLDYVYRVRAENLNGISPRTVDSGGKSFLAAGIPDDASGTFPQTLEITLREGLL